MSQAAARDQRPRGVHSWRHAVWQMQHGPHPHGSRATEQSARIGILVFASASVIGFAAAIVGVFYLVKYRSLRVEFRAWRVQFVLAGREDVQEAIGAGEAAAQRA